MTEGRTAPERIGQGRTAVIYGLDATTVVKTLRPGFDPSSLRREAHRTRVAHASGAPAPRVHGIVEFNGRPGMVLDRAPSSSMLERILADPSAAARLVAEAARIHAAILRTEGSGLPDVRERLERNIRAAQQLPERLRTAALEWLAKAPAGGALLHGDFHPGNVHGTGANTIVIDWVDAAAGHPAADIARSCWLVSTEAVRTAGPEVMAIADRFRRAYLTAILEATRLTTAEVGNWRLPVVAARVGEGVAGEQEALLAEAERLAG